MTAQDSFNTLQRLGLGQQSLAVMETAVDESQRRYAPLIHDQMISDVYRNRVLAKQAREQQALAATQLAAIARKASDKAAEATSRVIGIAGLPGDPAQVSALMRHARTEVAELNDTTLLGRALQEAIDIGDTGKSRACFAKAVEIGDHITANAFIAAYPASEADAELVWQANQPPPASALQEGAVAAMMWNGLVPAPLAGLRPDQIDSLAEEL